MFYFVNCLFIYFCILLYYYYRLYYYYIILYIIFVYYYIVCSNFLSIFFLFTCNKNLGTKIFSVSSVSAYFYLFMQILYSALFTNKRALMRYSICSDYIMIVYLLKLLVTFFCSPDADHLLVFTLSTIQ